jgi:YbbR domain-containing protein
MRIRDLFFSNLLAKAFSLFFAVLLWVVVIGEKHAQIQVNVPLELANIPDKAVVISDIPTSLSVQVQGPRTLLRAMQGRDIRRTIDLKGIGVGWTTIRILPDSIPVPRGIEVLRVTPATLDLKLEPVKEVRLTVSPQVIGETARGYRVEGITVDPAKVVLKGAESEIGTLAGVKTRPVNIGQGTTDVEEKVGLELDGLHLVDISPSKVWVRVKVVPIVAEKAVEGVSVQSSVPEVKATIQPDKIKVFVRGPLDVIDGIKDIDLQATVNLQGLEAGTHQIAPAIIVPQGVQVLRSEPPRLEVIVDAN